MGSGPAIFVGDSGQGGTFEYPSMTAKPKVTGGSFSETISVSTYSGMGIYFDSCIDATKYTGVSFTLASTGMPTTGMISFSVQINSDLPVDTTGKKGACVPASATEPYPTCHDPVITIPTTGDITVPFSTVTGGLPTVGVNKAEIVGLKWQFPWAAMATPYMGSLTVSNLKFTM